MTLGYHHGRQTTSWWERASPVKWSRTVLECSKIILESSRTVLECLWDRCRTLNGTIFCSTIVLAEVKKFVLEKFQKILKKNPRTVLEQINFVLEQFQNKSLERLWNNCRTPLIKCPI